MYTYISSSSLYAIIKSSYVTETHVGSEYPPVTSPCLPPSAVGEEGRVGSRQWTLYANEPVTSQECHLTPWWAGG